MYPVFRIKGNCVSDALNCLCVNVCMWGMFVCECMYVCVNAVARVLSNERWRVCVSHNMAYARLISAI